MPGLWSIRKWYMDCVSEEGTVWIGYWGRVRFGPFRLFFASSFLYAGGESQTKTAARRSPEPQQVADSVSWRCPGADVSLDMTVRAGATERQLYDGVRWSCVAQRADAVVEAGGHTICGSGYAEVLELDMAPWRVPVTQLRWGRLIATDDSLAWIGWAGAVPLRAGVREGASCSISLISDEAVHLDDGTAITFSEPALLRRETLGELLAPLWLPKRMLPARWLASSENKWRSRGTLTVPGRPDQKGWVIHELVSFPGH